MRKLALFDIDGTLLLAHGAGQRAMTRAGTALFGEVFSLEGLDFSGRLDPDIFAEATERSGLAPRSGDHERFRDLYLAELERELAAEDARVIALPGVKAALDAVGELTHLARGLLTGNYGPAARLKLQGAGLDPDFFPVTAFGDDAPDRPGLVEVALQRSRALGAELRPEEVVVIGDTPRDVECAHKNGARCVAVATGRFTADALAAAGADEVLEDLTEIDKLVRWLA